MKNNTLKHFLILGIIFHQNICAQTTETIQSSRPGNASGVYTVGKNVFQIENGIQYDQNNTIKKFGVLSSYFRYGLTEHFEFNFLNNLKLEQNEFSNRDFYLGLKYNYFIEKRKSCLSSILSQNFGFLHQLGSLETSHNLIFNYQINQRLNANFNAITLFDFNLPNSFTGQWFILNISYSFLNFHTVYFENSYFLGEVKKYYLRTGWFKQYGKDFQIDASLRLDHNWISHSDYLYIGITVGCSKRF